MSEMCHHQRALGNCGTCAVERAAARAELIPRMTFRELVDVELVANLLCNNAESLIQQAEEMRRVIRQVEDAGLTVTLTNMDTGNYMTPQEAMAEYAVRIIRTADLLGAILPEMARLQSEASETGIPSEEDLMYRQEFQTMISKLKANSTEGK